jgi:hypothetical protein
MLRFSWSLGLRFSATAFHCIPAAAFLINASVAVDCNCLSLHFCRCVSDRRFGYGQRQLPFTAFLPLRF